MLWLAVQGWLSEGCQSVVLNSHHPVGFCVANINRSCHGLCCCPRLCRRVRPIAMFNLVERWEQIKSCPPTYSLLPNSSTPNTSSSVLSEAWGGSGEDFPYIFSLVLGIHASLKHLLFLHGWSREKDSVAWASWLSGQGSPLPVISCYLRELWMLGILYQCLEQN